MRKLIIKICKWVIKRLSGVSNLNLPQIPPEVLDQAKLHVRAMELIGADGEWKRHQVYAKLIKEFPWVTKRTLALAIEVALCFD